MSDIKLAYRYLKSPVGNLLVAREGKTIHYVSFPTSRNVREPADTWVKDQHGFEEIKTQLAAYFNGELKVFDLPLQFTGTDFQKSVWKGLQGIPYGQAISYGALAGRVGNPKASRAVGAANGVNPISIIVPCHRVIGSDKSMTGFGGGIETKEFLLKLEGVLEDQPKLL